MAFALWAPPSLVGLPFVGLVVATRPRTTVEWGAAAAVGLPSVGLLLVPGGDLLTGFIRAYAVLVTAAFATLTRFARGEASFLRLAVRASLVAGVAVVALASARFGNSVWSALHWEATRVASATMRMVVQIEPRTFALFEPIVRFASDTLPATLALQTLAGLALAWQWHWRVARSPLGPPLAPFRQFSFGDHWVWVIVASLGCVIAPVVTGLKLAAVNVLIVLGALYLIRGIAIVVAFSGALGLAPAVLVVGGIVAAVLAVPLVLLVPGLATLGLSDTWLEFRRRLKAPA
ncbi:MAG TPA: DUF2232 domain-containing protein [Gemmatimonadales bacterium]|nr:DUF2232 domain-containing protein [Gemmatimonadales bacterium]